MRSISQWMFTCVLNPVFWALFIVLFFSATAPASEVKAEKAETAQSASKDCEKSETKECGRRKPVKNLIANLKAKCKKFKKCCKAKTECRKAKKLVIVKVYKPIKVRYRCCRPLLSKRYICCG